MPWQRRRYRGNKVWIEVDEAGALVLDERGLARLRYKPEDPRTYSVRPDELRDEADTSIAPSKRPRAKAGGGRGEGTPAASAPAEDPAAIEGVEAGDDIAALVGKAIHVYTDGASSGNPGPSGAGAVMLFRDQKKELSRYLGDATNNVAELEAVLLALQAVKNRRIPVRVHADSSYVIGVLDGSMRVKANSALVARIREEMKEFDDVRFVKVTGHAGVEHNERADALAREAIRKNRRPTS